MTSTENSVGIANGDAPNTTQDAAVVGLLERLAELRDHGDEHLGGHYDSDCDLCRVPDEAASVIRAQAAKIATLTRTPAPVPADAETLAWARGGVSDLCDRLDDWISERAILGLATDDLVLAVVALRGLTAERDALREAFNYVCGLLPCGPSPLEREADAYVVSCMVNVGELRRVRELRAALDRKGEGS